MKALAGTVLCARRAKVEQTESRLPLTVFLPWPAHFNHLIPHLRTVLPFHTPARMRTRSLTCSLSLRDTQDPLQQPLGFSLWVLEGRILRRGMRQTSEMSKSWARLKIQQHNGLPFQGITGAQLGVEQIKQTALYTQQQPEQSCQMSSAENRAEWVFTNGLCV